MSARNSPCLKRNPPDHPLDSATFERAASALALAAFPNRSRNSANGDEPLELVGVRELQSQRLGIVWLGSVRTFQQERATLGSARSMRGSTDIYFNCGTVFQLGDESLMRDHSALSGNP